MNSKKPNNRRRQGGRMPQKPMGMPQGNRGGQRGDNRPRGNPKQQIDKYKQLAREAAQSGDHAATEYWLQHADHWQRVLNERMAQFGGHPSHSHRMAPGEDEGEEGDEFFGVSTLTAPQITPAAASGHGTAEDVDEEEGMDSGDAMAMTDAAATESGDEAPLEPSTGERSRRSRRPRRPHRPREGAEQLPFDTTE